MSIIQRYITSVFSDYYSTTKTPSEGFYRIIYQILLQNSCEVNSKSVSDMIRDCSNKWSNIRIYVEHLSKYPKTIRHGNNWNLFEGNWAAFPPRSSERRTISSPFWTTKPSPISWWSWPRVRRMTPWESCWSTEIHTGVECCHHPRTGPSMLQTRHSQGPSGEELRGTDSPRHHRGQQVVAVIGDLDSESVLTSPC